MAKRIKVSTGDLFLIPRKDGANVLGQILEEWMKGVVCIAVFDCIVQDQKIPGHFETTLPNVLALPSVGKAELTRGYWPIIGTATQRIDLRCTPHHQFAGSNFTGASWHSGKMIEDLVNAYYGQDTWEPYPGRPGHLRSLLLPDKNPLRH
jgi:hypothetical protein